QQMDLCNHLHYNEELDKSVTARSPDLTLWVQTKFYMDHALKTQKMDDCPFIWTFTVAAVKIDKAKIT
ncbi:MAG: hypothetical protein VW949_03215, partial [Paracoccaceae bacterium]